MPDMPFVVAHRAGNDLASLRQARRSGAALVEADVRLYRSRLECRHRKTVGPLPILWDRGELAAPWTPQLLLAQLLSEAGDDVELMLDLKGRSRRLPGLVAAALEVANAPRITVCSRTWALLEPFRGRPGVRVIHSVGSARQLRALRRRFARRRLEGISIHRDLLDAATVRDLRDRAELVLTWPVEDPADARRLAAYGVGGVISRDVEGMAAALRTAPETRRAAA